jgi:hypothetical protein
MPLVEVRLLEQLSVPLPQLINVVVLHLHLLVVLLQAYTLERANQCDLTE